jgi:hypothetical protein
MDGESSRRHLFISHHSKDDADVSGLIDLLSKKGYDIRNSSMTLKARNQQRLEQGQVSKEAIERLLVMKLKWATTVVVLIGEQTHARPWVNWEIDKANELGKRIVGVYLRSGTENDIPPSFEKYGHALVNWYTDSIISAIDGTNTFLTPGGDTRQAPNAGDSIKCR